MEVIPAIDLRNGRCVRLKQGRPDEQTVYSEDPVSMARTWVEQGARRLHVVDLDGAFQGTPQNLSVIEAILKAVQIPVQVGGGLRSLEAIESVFTAGAERCVLGTAAVEDRRFLQKVSERFPNRTVIALDNREGKVAVRGWKEVSEIGVLEMIQSLDGLSIAAVLITDIRRDGMLTGPDVNLFAQLVEVSSIPIIASGGIRSLQDLRGLQAIPGLQGVILGKSLYEGLIQLPKAIALLERER